MIGKCSSLLAAGLACIGSVCLASGPAQAGKVYWKEDPTTPGCFALAFSDTQQWFATPAGVAFKRGVCFGQPIKYKVVLAPDGDNFTASGANTCTDHVDEGHKIDLVSCTAGRSR